MKASPSADSILFKSGGAVCPVGKSIWDALGDGTADLNLLNLEIISIYNRLVDTPEPPLDSILFKTGGPICPTGKSIWSALGSGAVSLDDLNTDLDTLLARLTATRAGYLDNINNAQLLNIPNLSTLTAARIAYLDLLNSYLDVAVSSRAPEVGGNLQAVKTDVDNMQVPIKFTSADALNDIAVTTPTDTTEKEIVVSLPTGASIVKVMLAALITVMNNTANAQKIDVDVKGRVSGGSWSTFFSQDDCLGFPAADGATTGFVPTQDVTTLVTGAGTYGFKLTITQSAAQSVRYTTQYVLIVTYKMSPP